MKFKYEDTNLNGICSGKKYREELHRNTSEPADRGDHAVCSLRPHVCHRAGAQTHSTGEVDLSQESRASSFNHFCATPGSRVVRKAERGAGWY